MSAPLFTVLMPVHRRADVVGFAIESVLRQTLDDFQFIIVSDGSDCETVEVVARIDDPRVLWLNMPKAPYFGYANRNIGMRFAKGRYVAYCAHDDILFPDHLERMAKLLERTGAQWAYSQPLWVSLDGVMAPSPQDLRSPDVYEDFREANFIPLSNIVHTREIYDAIGGWPEHVPAAADWLMWKDVMARIWPAGIAYLREPTMMHFVADWKKRRDSHLLSFAAALEISDRVKWWPPELRLLQPQGGQTLQSVAAEAMAQPDGKFIANVREGAAFFIARLATEMLCEPRVAAAASWHAGASLTGKDAQDRLDVSDQAEAAVDLGPPPRD